MSKDYYKTLGVDKSASKEDIKKSFRKLAHEHHPDKGGNSEKFKEASEAYSVLSDDQKRSQYDTFGSAGPAGGGGRGGYSGGGGFEGFDFSGFGGGQGQNFEFDLGDIFGDFFGGGRKAKTKKGRDISIDLELSFYESVFGGEKKIRLTKQSKCKVCDASGAKSGTSMETCPTCSGAGKIRQAQKSIFGTFMTESVCETCGGQGRVPREKCTSCRGSGVLRNEEEFAVNIPSDVNDGETIRLSGGGEHIKAGSAGDLYIKVHVKRDPLFKKDGKDLVTELNIKLSDALLGGKYMLKTLDGDIELKVPEGAEFGQILRIKGKGVPVTGTRRGDLLIKLNIKLPHHLSRKAREAFEGLKGEGI